MDYEYSTLEVSHEGGTTTIGFGNEEILDQINLAAVREQITDIVKQNQTETLAIEMNGVRLIPSGLLGLLISLKNCVGKIQILNPSVDVREVLEVTKLNRIFEVHNEVAL